MAVVKVQQSDILRLEAEINNLWGELNTCNIPNAVREEMEEKLAQCEEQFKQVLGGQASFKELETQLNRCDVKLALAVVKQAESEIPKSEHTASSYLALENILRELNEGHLTAVRARHEVKTVMRHHS
jgi:ribosome-associated translation inhibitor RaiA